MKTLLDTHINLRNILDVSLYLNVQNSAVFAAIYPYTKKSGAWKKQRNLETPKQSAFYSDHIMTSSTALHQFLFLALLSIEPSLQGEGGEGGGGVSLHIPVRETRKPLFCALSQHSSYPPYFWRKAQTLTEIRESAIVAVIWKRQWRMSLPPNDSKWVRLRRLLGQETALALYLVMWQRTIPASHKTRTTASLTRQQEFITNATQEW